MLRNEEGYTDPTADHVLAKEGAAEREKVLRRIKAGISGFLCGEEIL